MTLDDCICCHSTRNTTKLELKSLDSGNVSLEFTGDCCDISQWLSQLSSYMYTQLTELILHLKTRDSTTADVLQEALLYYYHVLESLKIDSNDFTHLPLSIPQFTGSQENNLHILSLSRCNLRSDVTRSLIHSLQSPHCRLHKLTMDKCTISTPNITKQNTISTKNNTTLCSLVTTDSLCVLNHILSNVLFTQMTEISLCITTHDSSEAEVLTKIPVSCPVLETVKIDSSVNPISLPLSISRFIGSQQNNLHTLSLSRCTFSSDVAGSLIHSLQSPHCRLHKLTIDYCAAISSPDESQQNKTSTKYNTTLCSLVTTDSLCVLNHILSNVFFTQMTELSLCITTNDSSEAAKPSFCITKNDSSEAAEVLAKIPVSCPVLETLKIDSRIIDIFSIVPIGGRMYISLPLPLQLIGSQLKNNLHTLSLRGCTLSSDVTRLLVHSLQSPHCKLYKLALFDCTIPTTDYTQLTTAIVSSTTITHLLFIDENIVTPSLTALASGLKQNTTIEQLAVDKYDEYFTEDQFRVLIDAVYSSAVQKLVLCESLYTNWFSTCTLSRNNVDIEWFRSNDDLYNKW